MRYQGEIGGFTDYFTKIHQKIGSSGGDGGIANSQLSPNKQCRSENLLDN